MQKLKIDKLIIVEGKYDKIRLSNIVDGNIIETDGFSVFNNDKLKKTIKALAHKHGALILTDSDTAGYNIRVYLSKILGEKNVTHILLPQIKGKESRKKTPSAQGYVGVEGTDDKILYNALKEYCVNKTIIGDMETSDLYAVGLMGCDDAKRRKNVFLKSLGVQQNISNKFLLNLINERYTREQFYSIFGDENQ